MHGLQHYVENEHKNHRSLNRLEMLIMSVVADAGLHQLHPLKCCPVQQVSSVSLSSACLKAPA